MEKRAWQQYSIEETNRRRASMTFRNGVYKIINYRVFCAKDLFQAILSNCCVPL